MDENIKDNELNEELDKKFIDKIKKEIKKKETKLIISDDIKNIFYLAKIFKEENKTNTINPNLEEIEPLAKYMYENKVISRKNTFRLGDEIVDYLQRGDFDIALCYDGDYLSSFLKNKKVRNSDFFVFQKRR